MGTWGGFRASWAALGALLGVLGGLLPGAWNAPGRGLGASWNDFEASRRDLGTYWDDLGAVLAAVGGISKIIDFHEFFNDFEISSSSL